MNSLICGSGFGLYGYLPAIYKFTNKIYLNKKYQKIFYTRGELLLFESKIVWYKNIKKIIYLIDYLIIAKRPDDQIKIIQTILNNNNKIKHIFLEKPLSVNPKKSLNLFKICHKNKINYSVGFLFEYVSWYKLIKKKLESKKKINNILINWNIKKDLNKLNSWKHNNQNGGGLIRYYGIHFIKLLSDFDFTIIRINEKKKNFWKLLIADKRNNTLYITLKYSINSNFSYKINSQKIKKFSNPFLSKINSKSIDPRCFFLEKYIRKNLFDYNNNSSNDLSFLNLWNKIESNSKNVKKFSKKY